MEDLFKAPCIQFGTLFLIFCACVVGGACVRRVQPFCKKYIFFALIKMSDQNRSPPPCVLSLSLLLPRSHMFF